MHEDEGSTAASGHGAALVCACYFSRNIFVHSVGIHVTYVNDAQFHREYAKVLREKGIATATQFDAVVLAVKGEIDRRRNVGGDRVRARVSIAKHYAPLHRSVYHLEDHYLDDALATLIVGDCCRSCPYVTICSGIYAFPFFKPHFCRTLLAELHHFARSGMPHGQPNSMNKHGLLFFELGFDDGFVMPLVHRCLEPLRRKFYPASTPIDSCKAFTVVYSSNAPDADRQLAPHFDNSEVTLNICLQTTGADAGSLYFVDDATDTCVEWVHREGWAVLHLGSAMHGASQVGSQMTHGGGDDGVTSAGRTNLVMWGRSSQTRNKRCPMCSQRPVLVETEGPGDGFTRKG
eukprot:Opistho-2@18294